MADASILKTKAAALAMCSGVCPWLNGEPASLIFDPYLTQTIRSPAPDPVTIPHSGRHRHQRNRWLVSTEHLQHAFSQGFSTGTTLNVFWTNALVLTSTLNSSIHPYNPPSASVSPATSAGVGRNVTRRNILVAENNRKIATWPSRSRHHHVTTPSRLLGAG